MDEEAIVEPGIPILQTSNYPPDFTASLSASFKLDEGYSDEPRGQSNCDLNPPSHDVMTLPTWLLGHSEADRAGKWPLESNLLVLCLTSVSYRACLWFATNPPHVHCRRGR